jgi:hypothetical protein
MNPGTPISLLTLVHVILSLLGIGSGIVVVFGLWQNTLLSRWTAIFLGTTAATSATGFLFSSASFGPPHIVGIISLMVLALASWALYSSHLVAGWRRVYTIGAVLALYLNVFVGVAQAFQKIPYLRALAPTQKEPPFLIAQAVVLILFVLTGGIALKRFHPAGEQRQADLAPAR